MEKPFAAAWIRTLILLFAVCSPRLSNAGSLTVAWDPPTDGITTGYILFYGTASNSYSQQIDVGSATTYAVDGLTDGTTYYFAVCAYDALGNFGALSAEVSATVAPSVQPVVTSLALSADVPAPQVVGTTVTWLAAATGGVAPYQFQWAVYEGGSWTVGPWTAESTWAWTPSAPADDYQVGVAVRSSGSNSSSGELTQTVPFTITTLATSPRINVASAAQGATATASSFYDSNYAPSAAIDGDRAGVNWASGGFWNDATWDAFDDWLQVDFASPQTISEVDVFTLQDDYAAPVAPTLLQQFSLYGITDFQVQYWDGEQWQTVPGGTVTGNTYIWRQFSFSPLTTPSIRVWITGGSAGFSRLTEVEAY